jgi:23S rRNA (uridine2552-2'-O)-methyltransferase
MNTKSDGYRSRFVKLKTAKKRKTSSNKWLSRQLNDQYVARSKIDGYRSRAAYKLLEINEKFHILKPGMKIVDLGAAPGGWSQVSAQIVKAGEGQSIVIALDLLEITPLPNVIIIQKDFLEEGAKELVYERLGTNADVVISDMSANTTGHATTDHIRIMVLCEQAFEFALTILKPGGHFVAKIFRGGAENELLNKVKIHFTTVKHFKPHASRKESTEFYLVALNKKINL